MVAVSSGALRSHSADDAATDHQMISYFNKLTSRLGPVPGAGRVRTDGENTRNSIMSEYGSGRYLRWELVDGYGRTCTIQTLFVCTFMVVQRCSVLGPQGRISEYKLSSALPNSRRFSGRIRSFRRMFRQASSGWWFTFENHWRTFEKWNQNDVGLRKDEIRSWIAEHESKKYSLTKPF